MPGRLAKELRPPPRGRPPEKGSPAWMTLVKEISKRVHNNQPICAQAGGRRKDGWPCESRWTKENGLCKMHGGNAPRGIAHHAFKHGREARVYRGLPQRFKEAYLTSMTDDDLLSLRVELALADARSEELMDRFDSGESTERWARLGTVSSRLSKEMGKDYPSVNALREEVQEIMELSQAALSDDRAWRELQDSHQHRRKLADTERRRLKDLQAYLTAEEALAIVARLTDSIIRHVDDKNALTAILHEVQSLTGNDPAETRRLAVVP